MLTLYHATQSRSVRPRWLLEEIGAPYELVRLNLVLELIGEVSPPDVGWVPDGNAEPPLWPSRDEAFNP